ncbi:MAG: hypothetical protein N2Z62_09010 [Rhodobacteraceae bacterium]|nr:hypothetical protein [Paracoccaceae bacterium]
MTTARFLMLLALVLAAGALTVGVAAAFSPHLPQGAGAWGPLALLLAAVVARLARHRT